MSHAEKKRNSSLDNRKNEPITRNDNMQADFIKTDSFPSQQYRISPETARHEPTRPFGITIIVVLMILGTFTMFFWIFWLQGITGIDDVTRISITLGLILLGTIFMSLAIGLWLGINVFRYLFIILGLLLIVHAIVSFLIDGTTSGLIFILPDSILIVYMLLPQVKEYFEGTPTPAIFPLKKRQA